MEIGVDKKFVVRVGRDFMYRRTFRIFIGWQYVATAPPCMIEWGRHWEWSPSFPKLIWRGGRVVGWSAFGRSHVYDRPSNGRR